MNPMNDAVLRYPSHQPDTVIRRTPYPCTSRVARKTVQIPAGTDEKRRRCGLQSFMRLLARLNAGSATLLAPSLILTIFHLRFLNLQARNIV